jgi:hypothetical protein
MVRALPLVLEPRDIAKLKTIDIDSMVNTTLRLPPCESDLDPVLQQLTTTAGTA